MSYETCREAFDAIVCDNRPNDPWSRLQAELYVWQVNTYGTPDPREMALGVVEELGEWSEAKSRESIDDATADIAIYATQLATLCRLDLSELVDAAAPRSAEMTGAVDDIPWVAGRLCHVVLKSAQGIRGLVSPDAKRRAVYAVLVDVMAFCWLNAEDLFDLVEPVARKVMARVKADLPMVAR